MKKSVMALAAVAATVLGISALGLAACDEEDSPFGNEHTITFDANGGAFAEGTTTPVTRKTIGGKLIAFPDDPTVAPSDTDYTFKGWSLKSNGTADDALSLPMTFSSDKTLYAIWGGEVTDTGAYEITFNPNGGTIASGQSVMTTVNGKLSSLPTATNGTREFLGWYKEKNSTVAADRVTTATTFTAAAEVFASWGAETQTPVTEHWVTFNANGGKYVIDGEEETTTAVETSGGVIATLPVPVRDGWEFKGYYKDAVSTENPFNETTTVTDTLTVYAHWEELGAQEQGDGLYVGDTLVKALTPNGAGEVKVEHVTLKTNDVIVFIYDGEPVDVTMKPDGETDLNSRRIAKIGGELKVVEGGTFTFYLTLSGGALWVTDEADPEESELQAGDGLYAGATLIKAFEINAGGLNEIMATDVVITEATTLEIKYGGKIVTDWTLKADSKVPQSALVGGRLSLEPATYSFYYNYGTKIMYVGIESGEDPVGDHTGAYVIGGVETALTNNDSIADTADIELYATGVSLTAGAVLTFKADGELLTAFYGTNCHGATVNEKAGTVTVTKTGTFNIYLRHYDADDKGNAACWTIEVNNGEVYEALPDTYYIVGGMNGWDFAEGCDLTASSGKYTRTIELTNLVEFKVVLSDADGKLDWDTQKKYTLSSKVAKTLTDGNFQITGGDGSYTITLSGTTVTVTKEGEEPDPTDPTYEKDGLYAGGTLLKEGSDDGVKQLTIQSVHIPAGTTITFVYGGVVVTPAIQANTVGSTRISSSYVCADGGIFTMYYKYNDNEVWIVYDGELPDPVESVMINGTEMTDNTANINTTLNPTQTMEYMSTLTLDSGDTISFTVNGKAIEVWIERNANVAITGSGSRAASFKTKMAGEFSFTLKYHTDGGADKNGGWTVYVDGPVEDLGEEPELVKNAYYLLGGEAGFTKISGYRQLDADGSITLEIAAGQEFKIARCKNATTGEVDWSINYGYGAVTTGSGYVSSNSDGNMVFKLPGTYTITLSGTSVTITSDDVEEPVVEGPKVVAVGSSGVWLVGEGLAGGSWTNGIELNAANGYSVTVEVTTSWLKIRNGGTTDGSGTNALTDTTYAQTSGTNIIVKSAGTYTFTWNTTTKKLTVTPA